MKNEQSIFRDNFTSLFFYQHCATSFVHEHKSIFTVLKRESGCEFIEKYKWIVEYYYWRVCTVALSIIRFISVCDSIPSPQILNFNGNPRYILTLGS